MNTSGFRGHGGLSAREKVGRTYGQPWPMRLPLRVVVPDSSSFLQKTGSYHPLSIFLLDVCSLLMLICCVRFTSRSTRSFTSSRT